MLFQVVACENSCLLLTKQQILSHKLGTAHQENFIPYKHSSRIANSRYQINWYTDTINITTVFWYTTLTSVKSTELQGKFMALKRPDVTNQLTFIMEM
jgi:hypothetical protein